MLIVEYSNVGLAIPDYQLLNWAENVINTAFNMKKDLHVYVASEMMVHAIRVIMVRKDILNENICFIYEKESFYINEYGNFINCPKDFCKLGLSFNQEIIKTIFSKGKDNS